MAELSYPFSNGNMGEAEWRNYHRKAFLDGVVSGIGTHTNIYTDSDGRQVKLGLGAAFVQGFFYENTSVLTLPLAVNTSGSTRIDRAVLRLDLATDTIRAAIKQGTPGGGAPGLTQTDTLWEFPLAQISCANNFTTITTGNITNERIFSGAMGTDYRNYTPTVTPQSGHSASVVSWSKTWYQIRGRSVHLELTGVINHGGTGASIFLVSVPIPAITGQDQGFTCVHEGLPTVGQFLSDVNNIRVEAPPRWTGGTLSKAFLAGSSQLTLQGEYRYA